MRGPGSRWGSGRTDSYADRSQAGEILAQALTPELEDRAVSVLALPRGGVPVAIPIARRLRAPLGLIMVRKLGVPGRPELAMGALARMGQVMEVVRHEEVIAATGVGEAAFARARAREEEVLRARAARYGDSGVDLSGREVVLVDDGLATGMTALAAVAAVRSARPARIVVAIPVGSRAAVAALEQYVDRVVCPLAPADFYAVSQWYRHFEQLSDAEVVNMLTATRPSAGEPDAPEDGPEA